jgi:hypothetical protein
MLEVRPAREGFIVFDAYEQEPIMRFDSSDGPPTSWPNW